MAKQNPFGKLQSLSSMSGVDAETKHSWRWFKNTVDRISEGKKYGYDDVAQASHIKKSDQHSLRSVIADDQTGKMFTFRYLPKGRDTLKYYDTFPLVITLDVGKRYMTGLNLHYIAPKYRQILLNHLDDYSNNTQYDEHTRLRVTYNFLKSTARLKWYKPCFKKYLRTKFRSEMLLVPSTDWNSAIRLPTEQFKKWPKQRVWKQSHDDVMDNLR